MAENKKNAPQTEGAQDDVMAIIRKGGLIKQAMTQEVKDEIEKEKDDRIKELKAQMYGEG